MRSCSFKTSDLYPLLGLGHRSWIREGGRRVSRRVGTMGTRCFKWGGLASLLLCDKPPISPASPAFQSMSFFSGVLLSSALGGERLTHADMHTYVVHTCTRACTDSPGSGFFLWPTFLNGPGRLNRCYLLLISVHLN